MSRWGRLVMGVLAFGWMNAVAQPCFMDMSMSVEISPPAMHGEHGEHGAQVMHHDETAAADCGHCPPGGHSVGGDCMTAAAADCAAAADIVADGRNTKPKADKLQDDAGYVVSIADPPPGRAAPVEYQPECRPRPLPAAPSLNLRYCIFLK